MKKLGHFFLSMGCYRNTTTNSGENFGEKKQTRLNIYLSIKHMLTKKLNFNFKGFGNQLTNIMSWSALLKILIFVLGRAWTIGLRRTHKSKSNQVIYWAQNFRLNFVFIIMELCLGQNRIYIINK